MVVGANLSSLPSDYPKILEEIKIRVRAARVRASLSVNREFITLYWGIGRRGSLSVRARLCG
jgi:hypothetical protein